MLSGLRSDLTQTTCRFVRNRHNMAIFESAYMGANRRSAAETISLPCRYQASPIANPNVGTVDAVAITAQVGNPPSAMRTPAPVKAIMFIAKRPKGGMLKSNAIAPRESLFFLNAFQNRYGTYSQIIAKWPCSQRVL